MGFEEVASLDAEVTVALGKKDKKTGKVYPKQAEGYYLGSRKVKSKRGPSTLHFLSTANGNLGVWGTTDLNKKLASVEPGTMVRITSTGTKPTPNGDMYTYKVEQDKGAKIEVNLAASQAADYGDEGGIGDEEGYSATGYGAGDEEEAELEEEAAPAPRAAAKPRVSAIDLLKAKSK